MLIALAVIASSAVPFIYVSACSREQRTWGLCFFVFVCVARRSEGDVLFWGEEPKFRDAPCPLSPSNTLYHK